MNNRDRGSCWHDKGFVSTGEKFTFRKGKDLPAADSLVDEPRGAAVLMDSSTTAFLLKICRERRVE